MTPNLALPPDRCKHSARRCDSSYFLVLCLVVLASMRVPLLAVAVFRVLRVEFDGIVCVRGVHGVAGSSVPRYRVAVQCALGRNSWSHLN